MDIEPNIGIQNEIAQLIAMTDNKHDFSNVFDLSIFQESSINCIRDIKRSILNEDNLLKTLFNLERNEQNLFQFKRGSNALYQISYKNDFSNFIDNMAYNPICVIDFDLGGFSRELIKYLYSHNGKMCTIYDGPEVKYDPAGKTNNLQTFIRNAIDRIGKYSIDQKKEIINQLKTQLKFNNLSRTGLQVEPKFSCQTPFNSPSQLFFTNRKISVQEYEGKAYSLIEKGQKNQFYMFDKSFANNTLNPFNIDGYKAFLNTIKEAFRREKIQTLDFLHASAKNIMTASKGSTEHYLAKRLGDAGQAIASRQIHNSILITHDRVLLAFALNIGVPRIVFTHPHQNTADGSGAADSGIYPISIFERNDVRTELQQKENILRDINSALRVISKETDGYNPEKIQELIDEYNKYSSNIFTYTRGKAQKIKSLIQSLSSDFSKLSKDRGDISFLDNINNKYKELIKEIYLVLPFLKINIKIKVDYSLVNNLNNFVIEVTKHGINLETFPIESLKSLYNIALSLNSIIETK
jgi:hypothetical protein